MWPGRSWPLGATWSEESTNFAVYSPEATAVWVCLFDDAPSGELVETRHELTEHTLGIWHGALPGIPRGQRYGFRAAGPWEPDRGLRFNPAKLLLDPYARAVSGEYRTEPPVFGHVRTDDGNDLAAVRDDRDSAPYVAKGVVAQDDFEWGGEQPMQRRWRDTVIYEVHVKGFTKLHDRIPEELRGTYAGLGHPVVTDYLRDLGVTAVELLPVHEFVSEQHLSEHGLSNYWGYNSIGYFAPHSAYSSSGDRGQQVTEFKQMVKNLHAAGIEVILDVVYNHTAEAGSTGPTLSFRGLDDLGYYQRVATDPRDIHQPDTYWDITGCGNTVDTNSPAALRLILDSLRYWVNEMHVDGFRFDLMSALTRTGQEIDMGSHLLTAIGQDPVLRHAKLIAEPWDISMDGYRVGEFPPPWVEWNDQFRDTMRDFWRSASDGVRTVATRLAGSSDLYLDDGRSPYASINFITAHDGFTLRDLVSYDEKHNEANREGNRDGSDNNRSWNSGVEGETDDPEVIAMRHRRAANLIATLCLSNGVPMITAGDERGRTQRGNNNPYSQDNEISWVDWRPDDAWLGTFDITRVALQIRREHPALRQRHWFEGRPAIVGGPKDLAWVHPEGREMTGDDWQDEHLHVVGMFVSGDPLRSPGPRGEQQHDSSFMLWLNGSPDDCEVTFPSNEWVQHGAVALSTDPGNPIGTKVSAGDTITLAARSLVLLEEV
ncbi:MAG: glycogen debranching enzyme GlgX [Marmoricola sp.]|nr:glycogen debranching enzyme GlgX [Marmoricola sp.]